MEDGIVDQTVVLRLQVALELTIEENIRKSVCETVTIVRTVPENGRGGVTMKIEEY